MDIVDFLLARFQEDIVESRRLLSSPNTAVSDRWYEERLLRECETKLMLIDIIGGTRRNALARMVLEGEPDGSLCGDELEWTTLALAALAAPHADHPDYQDIWRLTKERP